MPYSAEISRKSPSCFLFLIDQSGSMSDPISGAAAKRKADGVADAINRLLQNLIIKCAKPEGVRHYYDIGVLGYGGSVASALGGKLHGRTLVALGELAEAPAELQERTRKEDDGVGGFVERKVKFPVWFFPVANGGTHMCGAFMFAQQILADWLATHQDSFPPIVVNITDGESTDGDPIVAAQALTSLQTNDGNVLLFNCHISTHQLPPIVFPNDDAGLPDAYAKTLFHISSVLPEGIRNAAQDSGFSVTDASRGFAFNADLVELIRFLDIGTRPSNLR